MISYQIQCRGLWTSLVKKGASNWHTVLSLTERGFTLHRAAFHDAMVLCYGWPPPKLPYKCDCGNGMSVKHALTCTKGGFPIIRHDEIRDLTANLLTEVCNDICTESELQPAWPQQLMGATANTQDGASLESLPMVCVCVCVWGGGGGRGGESYFNVRVFNPHAPSNKNMSLSACYKKHDREKEHMYKQRYSKWSTHPSPLSFLRPLVVWEKRQQSSLSVLPQCCHKNGTHPTVSLCVGFTAV